MATFRILLDVNVYVAASLSWRLGRTTTAVQQIVDIATGPKALGREIQLVATFELLDTLRKHLLRFSFDEDEVERQIIKLGRVCSSGPDKIDPLIVLGGVERYGMSDREDAGILAGALSAGVNLLVTNNLKDFETNDSETVPTRTISSAGRPDREIGAIIHEPYGRPPLIVAHPFDALDWLHGSVDIRLASIRTISHQWTAQR